MRGPIVSPGSCLLVCLLCGCGQKSGDDRPKEDPPEVKWAQKVADEFLETLRIKDYTQQKIMTTKAFQESHHEHSGVYRLNDGVTIRSWSCSDKTVAPGGEEVSLSGTALYDCSHVNGSDARPGDWTVSVLKDKESGRWLVNYVRTGIDMTRRLEPAEADAQARKDREMRGR
jgi:hypothetical protein